MSRLQVLLAAVTVIAMVGCTANGPKKADKLAKKKITPRLVRHHMSPELKTVGLTAQQQKNRIARSIDTTGRQLWDDLAWLMLMDEPLHLTPYPVP